MADVLSLQHVRPEPPGTVTTLRLNRPAGRNAVDTTTAARFADEENGSDQTS